MPAEPKQGSAAEVPRCLREHAFAVPSDHSGRHVVKRVRATARSAVAAIAAHGKAIALSGSLLTLVHRRAPYLSCLGKVLLRLLEEGTTQNANFRARLRHLVAQIIFAGVQQPESYMRRIENDLTQFAVECASCCEDAAFRLRHITKTIKNILRDAFSEDNRGKLSSLIWHNVDKLLASTVELRNQSRCDSDVERVCADVAQTCRRLVRSTQIRLVLRFQSTQTVELQHRSTQYCRMGAVVRTQISIRSFQNDRVVIENMLENVGEQSVIVAGLHIAPPGDTIPVHVELPKSFHMFGFLQKCPSLRHSVVIHTNSTLQTDRIFTIVWDLHEAL